MSARKVEFLPDGKRIRVAPALVVSEWRARSSIDPRYALGTAQHEASLTINERDTEPSGFVSDGIYQTARSEAIKVGYPNVDMLTLAGATLVMVELASEHERQILVAAHIQGDIPDDVRAYMAIAHNAGTKTAIKSIQRYGLDWKAFKLRNANTDWGKKIAQYGDDCITGGHFWNAALVGEDVDANAAPSVCLSRCPTVTAAHAAACC